MKTKLVCGFFLLLFVAPSVFGQRTTAPSNQILFGTGTGVTSDWRFKYDSLSTFALVSLQHSTSATRFGYEANSKWSGGFNLQGFFHQSTLTATGNGNTYGFISDWTYGTAANPAAGILTNYACGITVRYVALVGAPAEPVCLAGGVSVNMGTGYDQSSGRMPRSWLSDMSMDGPIGVRPEGLQGHLVSIKNYFNGSPSIGRSGGYWAIAWPGEMGAKTDVTHGVANSYPVDTGYGVIGKSWANGVDGPAFKQAFQCGGSGSNWAIPYSIMGTCLDISDYIDRGIYIHGSRNPVAPALEIESGSIYFKELACPAGQNAVITINDQGKLSRGNCS